MATEPDFDAVEAVLAANPWLRELGLGVYKLITRLITEEAPPDIIVAEVRETAAYRKRFGGMAVREKRGYNPISEAEYLSLEDGYRQQLREFGVLHFFESEFDSMTDGWVGGDVSVSELNRRLDAGQALVADSEQMVRDAFQTFYGIDPSPDTLLLYFLNEKRGLAQLEDQVATATIGGEAFRYGLNITRTRADILRRSGVDENMARQGFANIAREMPTINRLAQIHRFSPLSQTELESFFFHEDPEVGARRAATFSQAIAEFQGGTAAQRTRAGGLMELLNLRSQTV
jgi:hypothetical protein